MNKHALANAWRSEIDRASSARADRDRDREWTHLERAHIVSQPLAIRHVRTHVRMLGFALRGRDPREAVGQLLRIVVAAPGSWTGKYPAGNTGGANVSAFAPMEIPEDLRAILHA